MKSRLGFIRQTTGRPSAARKYNVKTEIKIGSLPHLIAPSHDAKRSRLNISKSNIMQISNIIRFCYRAEDRLMSETSGNLAELD